MQTTIFLGGLLILVSSFPFLIRFQEKPTSFAQPPLDFYYKSTTYGFGFDIEPTWEVSVEERLVDTETGEVNLDFIFETDFVDSVGRPKEGGFTIIVYPNLDRLPLSIWLEHTFDEFRQKGRFPYTLREEEPRVILGNIQESVRVIGFPKEGYEPRYLPFAGNYYAAGAFVYRFLWIDRGSDLFESMIALLSVMEFAI